MPMLMFAGRRLALACLLSLCASSCASAQFGQMLGQRATVIENARIVTGTGRVIESGSIVINGGVIGRMGPGIETPDNARVIDAEGATVTPGLIDAWSTLGMVEGGNGGGALARASDAFDHYATADFRDAWRNGVTAMYVPALGVPGFTGVGAVYKLAEQEDGRVGVALDERAALCIDLGSRQSATDRLETFQQVRRAFHDALDYRESKDIYEEELEEYEKKIEERAKEEAEKEAEDEPKEGDETEGEESEETEEPGEGEPDGDEPESGEPSEEPDGDKPEGGFAMADGGDSDDDGESKDDEKKKDDIQKPTDPGPNRLADLLLEALDGELPIRVRADHASDILNALEMGEEFGFAVTIEGGAEAHRVASQLADADASVVLAPAMRRGRLGAEPVDTLSERVSALREAEVTWTVSGGEGGRSSRFVLMHAQRAGSPNPVGLVSARSAALLGKGGEIGMLRPGAPADLVIWDGDPLEPGVAAWTVLVDGQRVYRGRRSR